MYSDLDGGSIDAGSRLRVTVPGLTGYWVAEEQMAAGKEDGLVVVNNWVCCDFGGYQGGWFRFGRGCCGCYDEGKRIAETLTMDYHRGAGIEVRITRIFNTYGPRMCIDDGHVVSIFVAPVLRKEPLTIYGDGKQTRSFQYV